MSLLSIKSVNTRLWKYVSTIMQIYNYANISINMMNIVEYVFPQTEINVICWNFMVPRFLSKTPVMIQLLNTNELKNKMVKLG